MGLDMYLHRKRYVRDWDFLPENERETVTLKRGDETIPLQKVAYVITEAAYWRKANAIHGWFVDNVQGGEDDCRETYVSRKQLQELRDLCRQILDNPSDAEAYLPPREGFFFGSTAIDEWYLEDLQYTVKALDQILAEPEDTGDFYYHSSW